MKRSWAEISLDNIVHNMKAIRAHVPAGTKYLGVVKADAYGHGAVQVARVLEENGADYLAVACLAEAVELRAAGIKMPILILGYTPVEDTAVLVEQNITQTVFTLENAKEYSARAAACGGTLRVHIKLDTGMSRLGFLCDGDDFAASRDAIAAACRLPNLDIEGVFTHLAVSDEPGEEAEAYTRRQFRLFTGMIAAVEELGVHFRIRHCAATGGTLFYADEMALDMVRPGLLLYGYGDDGRLGLRPCMKLCSRITSVKTFAPGTTISYGRTWTAPAATRMGVIPVGYADGLHRTVSNKLAFVTKDGPAPQRGRICMDMCMIDLTELPDVGVGDVVEVFGPNASLDEMAKAAGTITYELLCSVSKRIPRIY